MAAVGLRAQCASFVTAARGRTALAQMRHYPSHHELLLHIGKELLHVGQLLLPQLRTQKLLHSRTQLPCVA